MEDEETTAAEDEAVGEAEGALIACHGDVDCNHMFSGPGCGGGAVCMDDWCFCW